MDDLSAAAKAYLLRILPSLGGVLTDLAARDQQLFELRLTRQFGNLYDGLEPLYGQRDDFEVFLGRLVTALAERYRDRPEALKTLDLTRELSPDWFQREGMIGYVAYAERFAGTLAGVGERLDYLKDLGVTYLHLMSVLRTREGENDGGYAVSDYLAVQPALGTMDDLEQLCTALRGSGVSLCLDLVLNHCADTHAWAEAAKEGDARYRDFFYTYTDRALPDRFEGTLPEVFPDFAPGNFTFVPEMGRWVWTTFNAYQWDLNYTNPEVFLEVANILLTLANRGVEVFRLDAVAFMWKRLGTDSQNQLEVHMLLQALRACSKIVAPAVVHKAEAIVSPAELVHYFGLGRHFGKVSNLAYHNSLMVQFWGALASRDTRLMTHVLRGFPPTPPGTAWATYMRCHDDIGWAVTDEDAAAVGLGGAAHRSFLSDYYAGLFPGSHAVGEVFQYNPATNDRRISGTFASLAGLEQAQRHGDSYGTEMSVERILLGFALMLGFGGVPLLYMGDELGLLNDYSFADDPDTRDDNRWLHRPYMDWTVAAERFREGTLPARLFAGVKHLIEVRRATPQLHTGYQLEVLDVHPQLLAYVRPHPLGRLLAVYNFSEQTQGLSVHALGAHAFREATDRLTGQQVVPRDGLLELAPYARLWLV
ncbi:MAG: GH13_4 / GH13_16 / GH13 / GH13_36 / GH13_ 29 / GH13_31 / GH13_17 / GH13_40 / GH13_30 / GH13 _23 / GH13_35 / GH13_18 / GH13_20 / GH13_2 [uncultured Truepera sp.]|uniref:GH13_4 / GH13_16 / GH13 / GH13_36 / GH13_ 29 / GH13_31 / GH13_17 / GH13_40 / GH13_30 / GH13 _23 / GH13_35 / GH13_18 / GH13_20 / GH13_2 n=1 Tax=uncultured Truepera sp. TaxID=543023 RepID=A0A6J4V3H4_9DEIN|nr:MAG: GH13_4 / GH13_16 / GH13 / GH13_36 / GH13_ 29 / GH13_31 / GH13_17 / GH13_40 / GH13_30 / GH13 _23 / GH13_35 / GH13_18 / GH13_20 / GH13_2 [uncultured Truepera sp.]